MKKSGILVSFKVQNNIIIDHLSHESHNPVPYLSKIMYVKVSTKIVFCLLRVILSVIILNKL